MLAIDVKDAFLTVEQEQPIRVRCTDASGTSISYSLGRVLPSQRDGSLLRHKDLLSRSLYRSHVLTTFLGPVLGAMMKQVCWHSRRTKAYRGLPEARGQSETHGDSNLYDCWGPLATPQGCCACVGQAVVCRASSHCFVRNEKMSIEDIHLALAPNPRVLLDFCAPSNF